MPQIKAGRILKLTLFIEFVSWWYFMNLFIFIKSDWRSTTFSRCLLLWFFTGFRFFLSWVFKLITNGDQNHRKFSVDLKTRLGQFWFSFIFDRWFLIRFLYDFVFRFFIGWGFLCLFTFPIFRWRFCFIFWWRLWWRFPLWTWWKLNWRLDWLKSFIPNRRCILTKTRFQRRHWSMTCWQLKRFGWILRWLRTFGLAFSSYFIWFFYYLKNIN